MAIGSGGSYAQAAARALLPHSTLGAPEIVKEALTSHRTIREVAAEQSGLSEDELRHVLDPMGMTRVLR